MNAKEKLEAAELLKAKAGELFKEGKYESAAKKYAKVVDYMVTEVYEVTDDKERAEKMKLVGYLNQAACLLKLKEYKRSLEACEKALDTDESSEKGWFRKGQSLYGLGDFEPAIQAFARVLQINADNKEAAQHVALSKQKLKESHEKEKQLYSKMLSAINK